MDVGALCARELMHKDVRTIDEKVTLRAAAETMRDANVSCLVVERQGQGDAFGIITRKDVLEGLVLLAETSKALLVEDVMAKPAITVTPDLSISHCLQMMRMVGVRRMPVVDAGELVGILSNTDVFRHLVEDIDQDDETRD